LAGAASVTADMLTEGTATRSAQDVASQTEALGAVLQSAGGADSASVTLNVMPDKLAAAMAVMADVARNPAFKTEELDRQRALALDGLQVAYQDPGQISTFVARPVIFAGTPAGHVNGGTPASLPRLKPQDLKAIHQAYYRPDNAVLVLTGAIAPEQGFALAEQAFGDWAKPAAAAPPQPPITPKATPRAVVVDLPGTGQAAVSVVAPAIARNDPAYYPAMVANTVLGGGYSARLNQEIRIKRGLSYGAGSSLATNRTTGLFRASAQTKNESAPEVLGLIKSEMAKLASAPASADELKARKSVLIGGFGRQLATTDGLADIIGNLAVYGVPLDEIGLYTRKVEAVTAPEVQAFAKDRFDPAKASVIIAGDAKVFAPALKATLPNLEVVPAAELDLDSPTLKAMK
jgi:zinc protease